MQLTFDRRIGVTGVIVAFFGVGMTILWPDAKWLGWLCIFLGAAGLATWMIAEARAAFRGTRLGSVLTGTIAGLAVLAFGLALWRATKPVGESLPMIARTTTPHGPSAQATPINQDPSLGRVEQKSGAIDPTFHLRTEPHPAQSKATAPTPANTHLVTVADRVKHIVVIQMQVSPNDVKPDADIETGLGGDPLDKQEILMNLEMEYNIVIPDKEATKIHTVGDLIAYIQKRTGSS